MEAPAREQQSNERFEEAYSRLLGSIVPLEPPDDNSDEQVVKQVHASCGIRLKNLIRLLDTEISPHIMIFTNLEHLQEDFLENIHNYVFEISDEYFNDKDSILQKLTDAKVPFASAIEARKTLRGKLAIDLVRKNNEKYYGSLISCTEYFESALQSWERKDPSNYGGSIRADIEIIKQLNEQRRNFTEIKKFFRSSGYNNIQPPSIEHYEGELRAIIAWLLYKISDEQAHFSIQSKSTLIKQLRETKKWLNLVLDDFELWNGEGVNEELLRYLRNCERCLYEIDRIWPKSRPN